MGRSRYKFQENYYPYFITCSVVEGISLFANPSLTKILLDALQHLQTNQKATVYAYIVMHNHLHIIIEGEQLSDATRKFKSYTARSIIDYLKQHKRSLILSQLKTNKHSQHKDSEYQVWQEGVHPKQISTPQVM